MAQRPKAGDADILREAKRRFERCQAWESKARENAKFDVRFAQGDALNMGQWDQSVRHARGDRPCLTNNKVRQHNLQVINDCRQNKAQIKITPVGGRATYEAAQVFSGIIRRIEYQSKAIDAYSTATYHQVESGIGYCRVVTDYADDDSMDLELFIRRIADPNTVYIDPDCKEYDKADANFAFVFEDIPRDRYEEEHGAGDMPAPAALDYTDGWNDKDHVRIAEYWRRNVHNDFLHRLADGTTVRESDLDPATLADFEKRNVIIKSRAIAEPEIEWFKIAGDRVVDREAWPGRYIPIVPFIGEESVIDGVMDRKGHTRSQIDAQRIYNYWGSAAVEQVALQSKTPYIGPARAFEGYETYWSQANVKNFSFLPYSDIDDQGQPIAPPQRAPPPVMAQAYVEGLQLAREDLMAVTGQYQAELGMPSNERSGVAIQQRQRQGDNATYHFIDNQAKAIRQVGRILLDMIPRIYDVQRVIKIMAEDGTESDVHMVPNAPDAHQQVVMTPQGPAPVGPGTAKMIDADENLPDVRVIFNPNVGRYDVEADVGPAFGTRRQEAFNAFSQILQQNGQAWQVIGDFWAQNADFPGADELAERLKRGLPPQYKPGPSPEVLQLQQALAQTHQNANQVLQQADAKVASLSANIVRLEEQLREKQQQHVIDDYRAETDRLKAVGQIDPLSLQIIVRQMVRDMLQTPLEPQLRMHSQLEGELQQAASPTIPTTGSTGGWMGPDGMVRQSPPTQVAPPVPLEGVPQGPPNGSGQPAQ